MKKLYPTLIISLLFLLIGCSTELDTLQKRDDTYYEIISEEPFSGLIINKYESGQKHTKGYLTNGREDGYWTWWYEGSPKNHIRLYLDNILDNLPYLFYDSWENYGQKRKVVDYLDGTKDGLSTEWYENGQRKLEGTYKDGERDGLWTWWYEDGQKRSEGPYKDGKPDGLHVQWYENGKKRGEGTFKDGKIISQKEWNEDGSVME
jgi:antitoxin component YwqK of YwqJK toxin-antitoxin module|tara:strand:- start:16 stop:630 length:615 start_codon:yes stop_codon:yes gene_type:complete